MKIKAELTDAVALGIGDIYSDIDITVIIIGLTNQSEIIASVVNHPHAGDLTVVIVGQFNHPYRVGAQIATVIQGAVVNGKRNVAIVIDVDAVGRFQ